MTWTLSSAGLPGPPSRWTAGQRRTGGRPPTPRLRRVSGAAGRRWARSPRWRSESPVWRIDQVRGRWTRVTPQERARPGEVLLVAAADGGYDPATGFDPAARGPVTGQPGASSRAEPAAGAEDAFRADPASVAQRRLGVAAASTVRRPGTTRRLLVVIASLACRIARRAPLSAPPYLHDAGKAHKIWQDALCALAAADDRERIEADRPWAKSDRDGRLRFAGDVAFRHELASLLLIDGPLHGLVDGAADLNLARYLVLAHHGKLRRPGTRSGPDQLGRASGS